MMISIVNSLPNDEILEWSKLKAFADVKINVTKISKFVLKTEENIVGKGENAGNQHFILFPHCFQKLSFSGLLKARAVWKRVKRKKMLWKRRKYWLPAFSLFSTMFSKGFSYRVAYPFPPYILIFTH